MAEDRNFMWDNLPGVKKPLTTEESEKLGTIMRANEWSKFQTS